MNKITATPTHSTEPSAPDYAVPDPQEAWEKMGRLVDKTISTSKNLLGPKPSNRVAQQEKVTERKHSKAAEDK